MAKSSANRKKTHIHVRRKENTMHDTIVFKNIRNPNGKRNRRKIKKQKNANVKFTINKQIKRVWNY